MVFKISLPYTCPQNGCHYGCISSSQLTTHIENYHKISLSTSRLVDTIFTVNKYSSSDVYVVPDLESYKNIEDLFRFLKLYVIDAILKIIGDGIEVSFSLTDMLGTEISSTGFLVYDGNMIGHILETASKQFIQVYTYHTFKFTVTKFSQPRIYKFIPTPTFLQRRNILNIHTVNEYSLVYCVLAHLYPRNVTMQTKRCPKFYENNLKDIKHNFTTLTFPTNMESIANFESSNNLTINIYAHHGKRGYPIRLTRSALTSRERHINLLLLQDEENGHFILINDLSLIYGKRRAARNFELCRYCQTNCFTSDKLKLHEIQCFDKIDVES